MVNKIDDEVKKDYVKRNNLVDSHIPIDFLFQVRGTKPMRKKLGEYTNGAILLLEETQGSLRLRHYGYAAKEKKVTYNLLYSDGVKSTLIKDYKTFLNKYDTSDLILNGNYTIDDIVEFLKYDNKRKTKHVYAKSGRRQRNIYVTDEELIYVKEFIKRMRENGVKKIKNKKN